MFGGGIYLLVVLAPLWLTLGIALYSALYHELGRVVGKHSYGSMPALFDDIRKKLGPDVRTNGSLWLARASFRLKIGGRDARVSFFSGGLRYYVRFELDVDKAPRISMSRGRSSGFRRETVLAGRPVGSEGLNLEGLPFTFATLDKPRVAHAFKRDDSLRSELVALFHSDPVDSVRIWNGTLTATAPLKRVQPEDLRPLLERLDRIASAFERVKVKVRVLGGERQALRGASGGARCAYCHGGITGEEPDLVACDLCHTVLHDGCWGELGHCPTLGCKGRDPERAGTRGAEPMRERS